MSDFLGKPSIEKYASFLIASGSCSEYNVMKRIENSGSTEAVTDSLYVNDSVFVLGKNWNFFPLPTHFSVTVNADNKDSK